MFDGSGWWLIFPIIGLIFPIIGLIFPIIGLIFLIFLVLMMSRMFGAGRHGSGKGRGMGPMSMMGMMGDDHQPSSERDESALEVLRKRYAAGELTDEEFDAKRRRLEGE